MTKLRAVRLTGTSPTSPRIRAVRLTAVGSLSVVVSPIAPIGGVEPGATVTIPLSLVSGTADSWTVRVITGTAGLTVTGSTLSFVAPADVSGTTLTIGVKATVSGVNSPEVTVSVNVLPQTEWWWTGSGWIPATDSWG